MASPEEIRQSERQPEIPGTNKQITVKKLARGHPTEENFELKEVPLKPDLQDNDVLVQNIVLSVDPYQRMVIEERDASWRGPANVLLGKPLPTYAVGRVVQSKNAKFDIGDYVWGMMAWEEYTAVKEAIGLYKIDPPTKELPFEAYIGPLGMTGSTAYHGLLKVGKPKEGETVFVSAATGAVGQVVVQIAKLKGCRVVGAAGSDEKVKFLEEELGADAAFNYKQHNSVESLTAALKEACPNGIDVYFENVGGMMLDAVLVVANRNARVAVCGMISQYNKEQRDPVYNLPLMIYKRLSLIAFINSDYDYDRKSFLSDMSQWIKEGKVKHREDVVVGIEHTAEAFVGLFHGKNFGKAAVFVKPLERFAISPAEEAHKGKEE